MDYENIEMKKLKFFDALKHDISDVILQYWNMLKCIYDQISNKEGIYKRKFNEVRYEFYQFLIMHKPIAILKSCAFVHDIKRCTKYDFRCLDSVETFLDFDKFVKYCKEVNCQKNPSENKLVATIDFSNNKSEIFEFLEEAKIFTSTGFNSNFKCIQYSDDKKWKSKQFTYGQLCDKIEIRCNDIFYNVVSKVRVDELSFTCNNTNKHQVSDIKCTICLEKFEIDQDLSRMPCGDFFHKNCIAKWLNIPDDYFISDSDSDMDTESSPDSPAESTVDLTSVEHDFSSELEPDFNSESDLNLEPETELNYPGYNSDDDNDMYYDIEEEELKFQCPNCRHCCY